MASETDICNIALSHIRAGSINSLDDNSLQAKQCKLMYPILRDQMLTDNDWQFSAKRQPLVLLDEEVFGYSRVYKYPNDCLYINRILPQYLDVQTTAHGSRADQSSIDKFQVPYDVMNVDGVQVIVTNYEDLRIDYRSKVTKTNLFNTQFFMTLSRLIASEVAIPLVGMEKGRALQQDNFQLYEAYLRNAVEATTNQQYTPPAESEFVTARL
tara:strand:- start:155 stop:790 length:636 start_codon:yes stop_codon:yes gene_type:complete